jgi:hypothetical protein
VTLLTDADQLPIWNLVITVIFALAAVCFAYAQWRLGDMQLRASLFGRRLAVHDAMRRLASDVRTTGAAPLDALFTMLRETRDATFLFKPDDHLAEFIHEFYKQGLALQTTQTLHQAIRYPNREAERQKLGEREAELLAWFGDQDSRIEEKFRPYLKLW